MKTKKNLKILKLFGWTTLALLVLIVFFALLSVFVEDAVNDAVSELRTKYRDESVSALADVRAEQMFLSKREALRAEIRAELEHEIRASVTDELSQSVPNDLYCLTAREVITVTDIGYDYGVAMSAAMMGLDETAEVQRITCIGAQHVVKEQIFDVVDQETAQKEDLDAPYTIAMGAASSESQARLIKNGLDCDLVDFE